MPGDQFLVWRKLLENPKRRDLQLSESDPQPGYYRYRQHKGDEFVGVAFWFDTDGVLRCLCDRTKVEDIEKMNRLWTYCMANPVAHKAYLAWKGGAGWGDVDDTVAAQVRGGSNVESVAPEVILADQVESALAGVAKYAQITSDEQAKAAQSLRSRLLELQREGKKAHEREKAPIVKAGRLVDEKWLPAVKDATGGADSLRASISAWETVKVVEQRRREREAYEAEQQAALDNALPEPELPEPEKVETTVKGGYGRAASVRTKRIVGEITDMNALFAFYKHREEVRAVLLKLANTDLKGNAEVPGITVQEVADIR